MRKTVIYCVIDAAPFWAVGAAEGGVACWETAECGVWRQQPGNILDMSRRIPNIGGDGCWENIRCRQRWHLWSRRSDAPRPKLYGYVSPSQPRWQWVLYCKKYSKLPKTLLDTEKCVRNTAHLYCNSVVRLIICYYIERNFAFVRSFLKKFLVDFPTTSLTSFRLFFKLGKCDFSQFRLNSSNGSSRNAIGFSFRKISCFARSRFPSASFKFLAPPKAAGDVLKNWLPWKKTFFAPCFLVL